jgi:two-component system sensor histidine kinase CpxA
MRSIGAKIVLWSLGTFALSLAGFWAISHAVERRAPGPRDFHARVLALIADDACRAYEDGGPKRLAAHLRRLSAYIPGEHLLTDARGRDLVNGADRSDLLSRGHTPPEPHHLSHSHFIIVDRPRGGRYRFISIVRPWSDPWRLLPYYAAIVLVIVLMGAILAVHLAVPLRRLRRVVDRFGQGDLPARARSGRKDEIGELSRAFDAMAERIETLLAAERRLLQDVSHELRSPLARLTFAVELARSGPDREAALDRVRKEADRMAALIGELLQLTRVEGYPTDGSPEDIPLDRLLDDIVRDCDLEAEARACRLVLRIDQPAIVRGERELLHRAVENVLRNAFRHAPAGSAVEVSLELREDVATITVRDYGPGVPEALLGAIFQPFFRAEDDRSRASGGVGLGLAIARRAVELHRGRIIARNATPGLGIAIELPNARSADEAPRLPAALERQSL